MESLFGMELSLPVKFVVAFAIVLALIAVAAFFVRRFSARGIEETSQRNRQPRLGVVDVTPIDNKRRLVIVRRDNVEHLLLVGGPTDVLIEPNIVRAAAAQSARDPAPARAPVEPDAVVAVAVAEASTWPEPQAARPPARAVPEEPMAWPLQPHEAPLTHIAAPAEPPLYQPVEPATRAVAEESLVARPVAPNGGGVPHAEPPRPVAVAPEPSAPTPADHLAGLAAALHVPDEPAPQPQRRQPAPIINDDQNIADMAHRLEAALRRPAMPTPPPAPPRSTRIISGSAPTPAPVIRAKQAEPRSAPVVPPPERAAPPAPTAPTYENLQKEMANLLGRPSGSS